MIYIINELTSIVGRTPRGVRGLKSELPDGVTAIPGRTPRGVRGLKSTGGGLNRAVDLSHPSRGAWIEI